MKYHYEPNCHIIDYEAGKVKFKFDENGDFETEDPKLIKWIKDNKNFLKGTETHTEQPKEEIKEETKTQELHCKKCDFKTDNKGVLMAHYREKHPKAGD